MRRSLLFVLLLCAAVAWGDDSEMLRRNVSKTPELETEHAAMTMLELYVPAQSSDGTLLETITYTSIDGTHQETRDVAKPLIAFYLDGHVEEVEGTAFGHGHRDAYAAVSLDDGVSWKRTNLSNSGDLSSIDVRDKNRWVPYPGDVVRLFAASAGNKAILVWASRYCAGGSPNYAMTQGELELVADHLLAVGKITDASACTDGELITTPCLYLEDHFGVAGSQGTSDFADEGYPQVGEVPFSCMWAARGVILPPVDESSPSSVVWYKAERLTSGRRDANRMEVHCEAGAGCVVTWQEDPEGLRPGEGEGPGEGWSGAIAHHQTDTWYSYIAWNDFDLVSADGTYGNLLDDTGSLEAWIAANATGNPTAAVPMSIPVRLTDNAMCIDDTSDDPYCYMDLNETPGPDICASAVTITFTDLATGQPTAVEAVCVAEDGRLMRGNTASTRPRTNLRGYDSDEDGVYDSAWVIMAYEENKGLGEEELDAGLDVDLTKVDMGKNIWYHTFDMFDPEVVSQGMILNQPARYPDDFQAIGSLADAQDDEYYFMLIEPDPIYEEQAGLDTTTLYQTEIARRFSLISQDYTDVGTSGTVAFAMWKEGIIRRGGPADVMARRFVVPDPDNFEPAVDNPYDYANMVCARWADFGGSINPRYVKGLCLDPAINLSGTTILTGDGVSSCTDTTSCQDAFPFNAYFDDLEGGLPIAKILTWDQIDPASDTEGEGNFDDSSWDNPYDVAKGHRGFMDGDFVMALYAWSPNWNANTVGHDNYNLYVRRSFDGGATWTTLPASFTHTDGETYAGSGTTTCEWMGAAGSATEYSVCTTYGAGDFEQARNVSQLVGLQETILDPRYSATRPTITADSVPEGFDTYVVPYDDDTRDPSKFFMVYETGDNTTVAEGEAEPLDLFYSRAIDFGDQYLVWAEIDDLSTCLPSAVNTELGGFCNEFEALEGDHRALSGEASVTANPGGTFFHAVWNQEDLDRHERVIGSDAWYRRVWFIDGDSSGGGGDPDTDNDGDGFTPNQGDCNDNNPSINPSAAEVCGDGIDNNCDGNIDEGCTCGAPDAPCLTNADCCSDRCHPVRLTCK